ncbi:extracellular solute-binding protein [Paenibacillus caui]|uniref:extracellular solute-binding protein n=1 Tax=Paenibacillus caui TaxID=2873927 RepID=UPI001CA8B19D|nr:extracellular solute-binding protein [Paenibacillus caui]
MKKWMIAIAGCAGLVVLLAVISILTFSEKEIASPPAYIYKQPQRPNTGIMAYAKDSNLSASPVVAEWKERSEVVKWEEGGSVAWNVDVPASGQYEVSIGYYPLKGNGQDIEFSMTLDGKVLGGQKPFTLNRAWKDASAAVKKTDGNELRPKQVEENIWLETMVREADELGDGTLKLDLAAGRHTIKLTNSRESAMLDYLRLTEVKKPLSYADYVQQHKGNGSGAPDKNYFQTVQAESPYLKSAAGLFPTTDRSSPLTEPYNPVKIRMNTIGGGNWDVAGQWISWEVEAPQDGWYKIGMRYHQNRVKGSFVSRKIYLDGQVPFSELEHVRFYYDTAWKIKDLGDENGEPYRFYLTKGTHEIKMEVTLGELAESLRNVQGMVFDMNQIYRKIVMITGVTPDPYRDYDLDKSIPELTGEFKRLSAGLKKEADALDHMSAQKNAGSSTFRMLALQLDSFVERPDTIPKRLDAYKSNVTGVADWILTVKSQPLELDYLYTASPDHAAPRGDANFAESAVHEMRAFSGSFMQNYDTIGAEDKRAASKPLDVWIGLGRDQAYVLNRMIQESFTPETGISVNLNLVKDALVKAVMAGVGPDINLFTNRGDTMNLAIRGALEPLDQFGGFETMTKEYMPTAFDPYKYENHTFAIPDEQQFFMMFYREDVLKELGLKAPETWDDLMKIAPVLQNNNLQIGLPYESLDAYALLNQGMGLLNLFPTLLMQHDSGVYNDQHTSTRFNEQTAYKAFKQWTDFYNLYDYPLYKNDFNRFWSGEMPIVITSYKLYNTLVAVAPEIDGTWKMAPIPGVREPDGSINRISAANGTAGIILKNAKNKEAAWKFMQWWNSPETQSQFVKELENEMGVLGRRTPANIEAFAATPWSRSEQTVLMEQWKQVEEVPELPGGYYTSRNIDNAFRSVVFQWKNPRESLYFWNKQINEEITRKRYEFGVDQ